MAKIPTRVSQVIPSGRVAGAVIPFDIADTGQGIEAQGLAGLGRGVGDLGISLGRIAFAEGTSQADSARVAAGSRINLLETELSTINDTEQYDAKLKEALEDIKVLRPDHVIGGEQFDDFLERTIPQWQTGVNILKIKQTQSNIEGRYILDLAEARTLGRLDLANELTVNARDKTGAITPEQAARDLTISSALIEKINNKKAEEFVLDAAFAAWESTVTKKDPSGDLKVALQVVEDSNIDDKSRIEGEIKSRIVNRRAEAKLDLANAIEAEKQSIDDIFILPREEFLTKSIDTLEAINSSTILSVKDKEEQRAKINKRIEAISTGKIDPVDQFDPKAYDSLSIRIARNSKAVNSTDISSRVGLGKQGGITTKQSEELTRLKKFYDGADVLGNSLHRTYTSAITGLKTAKRFSRNKTENIKFAAQARSILDSWAIQNPDATEDDYQAFFDRLIDNSRMNTWARGWFTRKAEEDRISIRENIEEIQKELAGETRKYKKGDTRIIGGVTYTFNGKTWND